MYDGLGNETGIQLSTERVVINSIDITVDTFFPINSVQLTTDNVNPGTRIPNTTWELVSRGRYLAGVGSGTDKNGTTQSFSSESTNDSIGEYTHKLTISEMPSHNHDLNTSRRSYGRTNSSRKTQSGKEEVDRYADTTYTGGSQSHNNSPPYFGVYIWKRIA